MFSPIVRDHSSSSYYLFDFDIKLDMKLSQRIVTEVCEE
jgi:hypothetical protein